MCQLLGLLSLLTAAAIVVSTAQSSHFRGIRDRGTLRQRLKTLKGGLMLKKSPPAHSLQKRGYTGYEQKMIGEKRRVCKQDSDCIIEHLFPPGSQCYNLECYSAEEFRFHFIKTPAVGPSATPAPTPIQLRLTTPYPWDRPPHGEPLPLKYSPETHEPSGTGPGWLESGTGPGWLESGKGSRAQRERMAAPISNLSSRKHRLAATLLNHFRFPEKKRRLIQNKK